MTPEAIAIKRMRRMIPAVKGCPAGCSECCGPITFSRWEWEHLRDKRYEPAADGMCPYRSASGCDIYEERPLICRAFGTDAMPLACRCDWDASLTTEPGYSRKAINKVMMEYIEILDESGRHGPFAELYDAVRKHVTQEVQP